LRTQLFPAVQEIKATLPADPTLMIQIVSCSVADQWLLATFEKPAAPMIHKSGLPSFSNKVQDFWSFCDSDLMG
jgi:hypothetical protein